MKMMFFLFLLFCSLLTKSQENKLYLIKTGKLFESETGKFLKDMAIVVSGKKILFVGNKNLVNDSIKVKAKVIDLEKYTVMPGLIDAHTHLLYKETIYPNNKFNGLDITKTVTMQGDAYRVLYGAARAKAYLESGITTVQDVGNSGEYADIALRKAINDGLLPGCRMICSGKGLSTEGGQFNDLVYKHRDLINDEYRIIKGPDDAVQAVRESIYQGADLIKIYAENSPNTTALSIEEMKAIVAEAHRYGLRVTAHAIYDRAIYDAVISGVDGIDHAYMVEDSTLQLMAKKGVVIIPTDIDIYQLEKYAQLSSPDRNIKNELLEFRQLLSYRLMRAMKAGVTIVAGSDDYVDLGLPFGEPSKRNLIGYYDSGMKIPDILKATTLNAAKHVNRANSLGSIKEGYIADIIAVDNTIEKDIHSIMNVCFVMKNGEVIINKQN